MKTPDAFIWLASMFHQDVLDIYGDYENAAAAYISEMKPEEVREIDAYLTALLSDDSTRSDLEGLWGRLGGNQYFGGVEGAIEFYSMLNLHVRDRLEILKSKG